MRQCTILWAGASKSGNNYINVEFYVGDVAVTKFVKLAPTADISKYAKGDVISIPEAALKQSVVFFFLFIKINKKMSFYLLPDGSLGDLTDAQDFDKK